MSNSSSEKQAWEYSLAAKKVGEPSQIEARAFSEKARHSSESESLLSEGLPEKSRIHAAR